MLSRARSIYEMNPAFGYSKAHKFKNANLQILSSKGKQVTQKFDKDQIIGKPNVLTKEQKKRSIELLRAKAQEIIARLSPSKRPRKTLTEQLSVIG